MTKIKTKLQKWLPLNVPLSRHIASPELLACGELKIKDSSMSLRMNSSQSGHNNGGEPVFLVNRCNISTKSFFRAT